MNKQSWRHMVYSHICATAKFRSRYRKVRIIFGVKLKGPNYGRTGYLPVCDTGTVPVIEKIGYTAKFATRSLKKEALNFFLLKDANVQLFKNCNITEIIICVYEKCQDEFVSKNLQKLKKIAAYLGGYPAFSIRSIPTL